MPFAIESPASIMLLPFVSIVAFSFLRIFDVDAHCSMLYSIWTFCAITVERKPCLFEYKLDERVIVYTFYPNVHL